MLTKANHFIGEVIDWTFQEKHRQKAREIKSEVEKAFTEHPEEAGETYLQHLKYTALVASRLAFAGVAIGIHGLFPFLFTRTGSQQLEQIYLSMRGRKPKLIKQPPLKEIITFRKSPVSETDTPRIGIIGGGFAGTMVLANLVRQANSPMIVEWFDENAAQSHGVAYGSADNIHLLNVRTDRMGAFAGQPEGFYEWLQSPEGRQQTKKLWPEGKISAESFAPRILYGTYLQSVTDETMRIARSKSIDVRIIQAQVTDARVYYEDTGQLIISSLKGGITKESLVDAVALATGNLPPQRFSFQNGIIRDSQYYITNIWNHDCKDVFPDSLSQLSTDSDIVIIGTGLTMIDAVLTIRKHGFKGSITAISRHGWMPAPHASAAAYPLWEWTDNPDHAPETALGMLRRLRQEIRKAVKTDHDWRAVIDSLRPHTPLLWQRLSLAEKRRFMNRLFTLWNIHRHRMAPEIYNDIKQMIESGSLKIIPGRIYYAGSDEQGITVAYRKRGTSQVETIRAAMVLNCTGPEYDIGGSRHKLLKNLRDRDLITVGPLRMGIDIHPSGGAKGRASDAIFPIGTLLVGNLLECTAVPELREHAANVAEALLDRVEELYASESVYNKVLGAWI